MLLGECKGTDESFNKLEICFLPIFKEVESLGTNGISAQGNLYKAQVNLTCDFKVLYSILGCFGPSSRFPCIYCAAKRKHMDLSRPELLESFRYHRLQT